MLHLPPDAAAVHGFSVAAQENGSGHNIVLLCTPLITFLLVTRKCLVIRDWKLWKLQVLSYLESSSDLEFHKPYSIACHLAKLTLMKKAKGRTLHFGVLCPSRIHYELGQNIRISSSMG